MADTILAGMDRVGAGATMRRTGALAIAAVVMLLATVADTNVAIAADGYTLESSASYVVDPATTSIRVEVSYRMTNTSPDRDLGNGRIQFFYFDGVRLPVGGPDDGVVDLSVLVDGRPAVFRQIVDDDVEALDIDFPFRLRYRRTATITVSYRLTGAAPRSTDSFVRANPAYMAFPIYLFADAGRGTVRVEVPSDWTTDYIGSELVVSRRDDVREYAAEAIAEPNDFGVLFTARLDSALVSTPVSVGDARFEVRSWPGDEEWRAFAQRNVVDGVPVLERLVGTAWPATNETEVVQASTPYLRGYAGFYVPDADLIEVGERLDAHTILHELAHAWFNRATITDRWISEGLADEISARAVAALGGELPSPDDYDGDDGPVDVEPFPLSIWEAVSNALDDTSEYYGYRTSFQVMRDLTDEIGEDRMTALVAAILAVERAYPAAPGDDPARPLGPVGWREFLDLAEQVGGSVELEAVYRELVLSEFAVGELDRRRDAIGVYDALADRGGGSWTPPEAVRSAMARWQWSALESRIGEANAALDARDGLASVLDEIDLVPAAPLAAAYRSSIDLSATIEEIELHEGAAARLVAARTDLAELLTEVGYDVPSLTQDDYDERPLASADDSEVLAAQAGEVRDRERDLSTLLDPHDLSIAPLPAVAFVESPVELIDALDARIDATRQVVDVHDARDAAGSILERIGSVGSDADARLTDAATALAEGDLDAAVAAAGDASESIAGFAERGVARLVAVALGLLIGLGLVWARSVVRSRRSRRPGE